VSKAVMVSGATTAAGVALIERLIAEDPERRVLAVALDPAHETAALWRHPQVDYRCVDLVRNRRLRGLLFGAARDLEIDTVVHLAMHRSPSARGAKVHRLNVEVTRELLHMCEDHPTIRRFIFRSFVEVYDVRPHQPDLIGEDHPLNLSSGAPQWVRDRVHADLTACTQLGLGELDVVVLRCAECVAPGVGSQLHDYLQSRVCYRAMGYDPMMNLLSFDDLVRALQIAVDRAPSGIFNIQGKDTLPLSEVVRRAGRMGISVPGALIAPLYAARTRFRGGDFSYDVNSLRFHFSGILDGRRTHDRIGYCPESPIDFSQFG